MEFGEIPALLEEIGKLTGAHLLAGGIGGLAGYGLRVAQDLKRRRGLRKAVNEFFGLRGDRLLVIHSAVLDNERHAYNLPACDTRAARAIAKLLESAGQSEGSDFEILPEAEFLARFKTLEAAADHDLVLLCGPKRNSLVAATLTLAPHLRYQLTYSSDTGLNVLCDKARHSAFVSSRDAPGGVGDQASPPYDFGMILSMPSPLDVDRHLVVLAGIHGTGTLAAAQFISDSGHLRALTKRAHRGVVQEVVRAEYVDNPDVVSKVLLV